MRKADDDGECVGMQMHDIVVTFISSTSIEHQTGAHRTHSHSPNNLIQLQELVAHPPTTRPLVR